MSRPVPSEAEYVAKYLKYFDQSQIEKLDYVYEGAIGGERTVARVQFKEAVRLKEGIGETGTYDPEVMTKEPAASEFRESLTFAGGGTTPPWFDFPFNRQMRMIREAQEEASDANPIYEWTWYIDDQRHVVYFVGVKG